MQMVVCQESVGLQSDANGWRALNADSQFMNHIASADRKARHSSFARGQDVSRTTVISNSISKLHRSSALPIKTKALEFYTIGCNQ
jgi:hypothetical protein